MKNNRYIELLKAEKAKKMGKVITKSEPIVKDEDLSLKELKLKYPHITSNSQSGFLKKLKG